jgi:hypothetical protein
MPSVEGILARMRDGLLGGASGALTRGGCRAAVGAADAELEPLAGRAGEIGRARAAVLRTVEADTGDTGLSAALDRAPAEDERLLGDALAALDALGRALGQAGPTAVAQG